MLAHKTIFWYPRMGTVVHLWDTEIGHMLQTNPCQIQSMQNRGNIRVNLIRLNKHCTCLNLLKMANYASYCAIEMTAWNNFIFEPFIFYSIFRQNLSST